MNIQPVIVSGRAGSGKTSTANEISEQLKRRGVCHAHIDGDYLINTTNTPSMLGYYFDEAQSAQIPTVVTDESNLA
ncbi:uncharacterized protein VB005_11736 [Metarhizium brunneum]